jgi:hypothetical protein
MKGSAGKLKREQSNGSDTNLNIAALVLNGALKFFIFIFIFKVWQKKI